MPIAYTIRYVPGKFHVVPATSTQNIKYWNVVDDGSGAAVGLFFDENMAQTVCLAMDLMNSTIHGDRTRVRELLKLIEALRQ